MIRPFRVLTTPTPQWDEVKDVDVSSVIDVPVFGMDLSIIDTQIPGCHRYSREGIATCRQDIRHPVTFGDLARFRFGLDCLDNKNRPGTGLAGPANNMGKEWTIGSIISPWVPPALMPEMRPLQTALALQYRVDPGMMP